MYELLLLEKGRIKFSDIGHHADTYVQPIAVASE